MNGHHAQSTPPMRELFLAQALLLRSSLGYQTHGGHATGALSSIFERRVVCPPSVCSTACGGKHDGVHIPPSHCASCSDQRTGDYDWQSKSGAYCTLYKCNDCEDGLPVLFPTEFSFSEAQKIAGADGKKVPFAFVSSGGGDRASAGAAGFARSLAVLDGWQYVTHLSTVSGGSWFSSQFVYSAEYHRNISDPSVPIADYLADWGRLYFKKIQAAMDAGELLDLTKPRRIAGVHQTDSPYGDWAAWTRAMLRTASAVASETPSGFDSFHALIDTMATLPDAWLGPSDAHAPAPAAALLPCTADPTTARWTNGSLETGVCLPLYHSRTSLAMARPSAPQQPAGVTQGLGGGWTFGAFVSGFSTESNGRSARLSLPVDPPLELTVGASSADIGWLASPTMVRHDPRWARLTECMPGRGRVDKLAVGLPLTETPRMRVWDGSVVDKLGLAAAVARMQAECAASGENGLDCSNDLYAIVLDHDPGSAKEGPLRYKFAIPRRSFTTNGSRHDLYPYQVGDLMAIYANSAPAPAAQLFREPYPPPDEWTPWLHTVANREFSGIYWRGALSTVDNPWYGVHAGTRVQLLVLKPNLELPTFEKPSAVPYLYQQHYGPAAAAIADAATPIIKKFLLESRRNL